jgi:pimeloyl-ACP methyl ester carboxylesterase
MPQFQGDGTTIYDEVHGSGFPLLLLAPGGMHSAIPIWASAAINPLLTYTDEFRCAAMDQRNAGQSSGPLGLDDPWGSYAADQLAPLDQLGIACCLVMGFCVGGSYILKLLGVTQESRLHLSLVSCPPCVSASSRTSTATTRPC